LKPASPVLRFSPTAWAKLLFFRDRGESEIGGFGITAANNLLRIDEFVTVRQEATMASIAFDDLAVADFFETQVDAGRRPEQFARIWLHTHPGNSAQPSSTDEETFCRVFGRCQWAVMFILARSGHSYARLRFNTGPGGEILIPVEVDYHLPFGPSAFEAWEAEYQANVRVIPLVRECFGAQPFLEEELWAGRPVPAEWLEDMAAMDPAERQLVLDELADWSDPWEEESEVDHERDRPEKPV
jgi:proteasome lid subunit RPN8/RPN11